MPDAPEHPDHVDHAADSRDETIGVLLAAGRSRRMGTAKLLLPWPPGGSSTVLASAFDAIAPWCRRMIVVVGSDAEATRGTLAGRRCDLVLGDPDGEMFGSVRRGVEAAMVPSAQNSPNAATPRFVLLHAGDHPMVAATTMATILRHAAASPSPVAVIPVHGGRGGHPVVIAGTATPTILAWRGDGGLAGFWRERGAAVARVAVDDPGVVVDLDTPEDYLSAAHGPPGRVRSRGADGG